MKTIWLSSQQRDINIYIKFKHIYLQNILGKFYYLQWELVKAEVGFPQYFQLQSPVFISAFFLAFFNIVVHLSLSMNCAFGRALNGSTIVVISCGHYSHHALCVFIYLSDSHLAAITNASNCNQQPLGAFNASAAVPSLGFPLGKCASITSKFLCLLPMDRCLQLLQVK